MRPFFVVLLFCAVTRLSCQSADNAVPLTIHYVHPNTLTICRTEPVSAPKGYRLMEVVSDGRPLSKQTLVAAEPLLSQADLKSIVLTRSSGGPGCELVFPEAMRERLKAIRLNNTTGTLAIVLSGDTLVTEVSTLNISDLRISIQVHSKVSLERMTKLAASIATK